MKVLIFSKTPGRIAMRDQPEEAMLNKPGTQEVACRI
jgi:hypothetical protein